MSNVSSLFSTFTTSSAESSNSENLIIKKIQQRTEMYTQEANFKEVKETLINGDLSNSNEERRKTIKSFFLLLISFATGHRRKIIFMV